MVNIAIYGFALYFAVYIFYNKSGPFNILLKVRRFAKRNEIKAVRCDICLPFWLSIIAVTVTLIAYCLNLKYLMAIIDGIAMILAMNGIVIFVRKLTGEAVSADPEAKALDYE